MRLRSRCCPIRHPAGRQLHLNLLCVVLGLLLTRNVDADAPESLQFTRDIRPILSEHCFKCHGPDQGQRQADLRLDHEQGLLGDERGFAVVVPGSSEKSELYRRLMADDPDERMPPGDEPTLTREEIELIRRWIDEGANWEQHWSFTPPVKGPLPEVQNADWATSPIDHFVLARLQELGQQPSPSADRLTLIRRVTLDLTGLPPEPEQVRLFLEDNSPDAYETVVDRLLRSGHFGEHMARYWLDSARYGDTHGLHLDNYREMWPWRDWVIRSFNENRPFDQFTVWQLAGDLLPEPTEDQLVATGFNRCHVTTNEGGSIAEEVYVRNVVDRVSTTGVVFMGLTLGCAVCHDHKFDPISQREFYQMFAYFNSIDGRAMDGNVKDHAPSLRVPSEHDRRRLASIDDRLKMLASSAVERRRRAEPAFQAWLAWQRELIRSGERPEPVGLPEGIVAHFPLDEGRGNQITDQVNEDEPGALKGNPDWVSGKQGSALRFSAKAYADLGKVADFDRQDEFSYGAWIKVPAKLTGAAIAKMNSGTNHRGYDLYISNRRVSAHLINRWPNYAIKVTTKQAVLKPNQWHHVFVTYDGTGKAAGVSIYIDGIAADLAVNADSLREKDTIKTPATLLLGRRTPDAPLVAGQLDDVRIYNRELAAADVSSLFWNADIAPILATAAQDISKRQLVVLRDSYLHRYDSRYRSMLAEQSQLRDEQRSINENAPTTLIFRERPEPREAFILTRGQYDSPGEKVSRQTPSALPPMPEDFSRDRLGLARWLVSPDHPLTSRVAVNRFWQQCFGTGLVKTSEDFGSQGEPPSHPRLLDWLAVDFQQSGWDVKRLMKMIVMSSTYRQDSRLTPQLRVTDPENRWLARGPRFRLDAETLRDQALAVSGLLVDRIGGPAVKPPQPDGLWYAVGYSGSNTVRFVKDRGPDKVYRRSLYTFWKRTAPPPQMNTFDAPSREACVVRRERTNTPLQALLLMNDPQYVEAARALAQRTMIEGGKTDRQRAAYVFQLCLVRAPTEKELVELISVWKDHLADFRAHPQRAKKFIEIGESQPDDSLDPVQLAAWTLVANLILNLDEMITKG